MFVKIILATVAVFVAWFVMDWVIHGMLLMPTYEETADLWRPEAEMKHVVMSMVNAITALCLATIYALYIRDKGVRTGLIYGLLLGVAFGVGMGFGSYSYQPIPYFLAQAWFWAGVVEVGVAGLLLGLIIKD